MPNRTPERMCAACRVMRSKPELIRVVLNKSGEISIDETGKKHGRGAYICLACVDDAYKKKALERSFKQSVEKEVYTELKELGI